MHTVLYEPLQLQSLSSTLTNKCPPVHSHFVCIYKCMQIVVIEPEDKQHFYTA